MIGGRFGRKFLYEPTWRLTMARLVSLSLVVEPSFFIHQIVFITPSDIHTYAIKIGVSCQCRAERISLCITDLLKGLDQKPDGVSMEDLVRIKSSSSGQSEAWSHRPIRALRSEDAPTPIILISLRSVKGNIGIASWLS